MVAQVPCLSLVIFFRINFIVANIVCNIDWQIITITSTSRRRKGAKVWPKSSLLSSWWPSSSWCSADAAVDEVHQKYIQCGSLLAKIMRVPRDACAAELVLVGRVHSACNNKNKYSTIWLQLCMWTSPWQEWVSEVNRKTYIFRKMWSEASPAITRSIDLTELNEWWTDSFYVKTCNEVMIQIFKKHFSNVIIEMHVYYKLIIIYALAATYLIDCWWFLPFGNSTFLQLENSFCDHNMTEKRCCCSNAKMLVVDPWWFCVIMFYFLELTNCPFY